MNTRNILKTYTYTLAIIIYIPIIIMIIYSFNNSNYIGEWKGFTLRWYKIILNDPKILETLTNSLIIAIASSITSIALAIPPTILTTRLRNITTPLTYPPIIIPEIAEAVALMLLFITINFPLGAISVYIGHIAFNIAYAYITLLPQAGKGEKLAQAAKTLGADTTTTLTKILIPITLPGILAATTLTFMLSFTDFIKTLFTAGPGFQTLPLLIWNRARRPGLTEYTSQNALNAIASLLIITSITIAATYTIHALKQQKQQR
ncbi:MAG: ABC transporter permease subunit [Desulfurococcales archaeon]|nr:ABC transporter permease subunit [Desulfurococcales archaeon]